MILEAPFSVLAFGSRELGSSVAVDCFLSEPSQSLNGQADLGRSRGALEGQWGLGGDRDHPTTADGRAGLAGGLGT